MLNNDYKRREDENCLDYAMRLIGIKKELKPGDLDWCDIVELLGLDYNPDSLRKSQDSPFGGLSVYKEMKKRLYEQNQEDSINEITIKLQELQKMRFAIADERTALNKLLREKSRDESLEDLAMKCIEKMDFIEFNTPKSYKEHSGDSSIVICLSDFHLGLEINEFNNKYNKEIFEERFNKLLEEIINFTYLSQNVEKFIVIGLGDFIAGLIHNVIRVESRENVVQQTILVSDAIIKFLNSLASILPVEYYDCIGNHSRLFENKDNCLTKESFDVLIHYILEKTFINNKYIRINDYTINEKIGEFECYGKKYAFCHGDSFNIDTLAKDLSSMTKNFYEAIFIGHIHHVFMEEQNGTYVVSNGSFAGNDEFSNKIRKTSNPSQNIFLISWDGIKMMKTIKL